VLLPVALAGEDVTALEGWLNEVFTGYDDGWFLRAPAAIGAPDSTAADPGLLLIRRVPWPDMDDLEEDSRDFTDRIGYRPGEQIQVSAMINRPVDHLVLGHICLTLARRYDALVDFDGAVDLADHPPMTFTEDVEETEQLIAAIETAISVLPGKVYSIRYATALGTPWITHIGDAEFLAAWLDHPRFHMIK
jgi:Family of unknown function (DUF6368)